VYYAGIHQSKLTTTRRMSATYERGARMPATGLNSSRWWTGQEQNGAIGSNRKLRPSQKYFRSIHASRTLMKPWVCWFL